SMRRNDEKAVTLLGSSPTTSWSTPSVRVTLPGAARVPAGTDPAASPATRSHAVASTRLRFRCIGHLRVTRSPIALDGAEGLPVQDFGDSDPHVVGHVSDPPVAAALVEPLSAGVPFGHEQDDVLPALADR